MKQPLAPLLVTLAALLAPALSPAQAIIRPGDKLIRYDLLKPSHDFYRTTVYDSSGKLLYDFMMEDFTFIDSAAGRITFARTRQVPAGNFETDTSFTDLQLRPVRMHEVHFQRQINIEMSFEDTTAFVHKVKAGVSTSKVYPMKKGYFEYNMIEYVFGYLDLQKGITYTLDNFNSGTPVPSDPFTVTWDFDDVWFLTGDNQISCRVLKFTHGPVSGHIWTDRRSGKILKMEAEKGGAVYFIVRKI